MKESQGTPEGVGLGRTLTHFATTALQFQALPYWPSSAGGGEGGRFKSSYFSLFCQGQVGDAKAAGTSG